MNSRIDAAFNKGKKTFIPFIAGGDPNIETTEKLIYALYEAGADIIEIGIPFSDPTAEGPVIESAYGRALKAGCTVDKLFAMIKKLRKDIDAALLLMTYYNPIFAYGIKEFIEKSVDSGIDGLIVPDLPYEERGELLPYVVEAKMELISLIAPTSSERIENIAKNSSGFLYCVSSLGVTGERNVLDNAAKTMIERVRTVSNIPCAVGFGISNPDQARSMASFADGVIIGSAIVRIIAQYGNESVEPVSTFVKEIRRSL